uniref:HMA domain-containing protein n=1 Tax=Aegilops tauschii subsp. strangulata TaxID=200361 RepID=A0A453DSG7_AEGTS
QRYKSQRQRQQRHHFPTPPLATAPPSHTDTLSSPIHPPSSQRELEQQLGNGGGSAEMTKDEDFKLVKIQTHVLRVNIHCDGCKHKVKKLLQRIEGTHTPSYCPSPSNPIQSSMSFLLVSSCTCAILAV